MNRIPIHKNRLLIATAMTGLFVSSSAFAFDTKNWNWDLDIQTDVIQTATTTTTATPTGLAVIENEQTGVGTLTALSNVGIVTNTPTLPVTIPPTLSFSTDDLAVIDSDAIAVMNNASIQTDVKTDVDSVQVAGPPATIVATSTLAAATNTRIESTATGVGNNLTIDLVTTSPEDAFLFANNNQTASVDITASSLIAGSTVTNFSGLGLMDEPLVSSQASAIGNNFGVKLEGVNTNPPLPPPI